MSKKKIIVWDLGATKCAAALVEHEADNFSCSKQHAVKLKDCSSLNALVKHIEERLSFRMSDADSICIGAAGQYDGEVLHLASAYPYPMQFAKIANQLGWPAHAIVHDYTPIVCATFTNYMKTPENVFRLNNCEINPLGRRVAFGIGTGLGLKDGVQVSKDGEFWLGTNEIGHIGIPNPPILDKRHDELIQFLKLDHTLANYGPLSFEKILSGQGLVRLYKFLYQRKESVSPELVGEIMQNGKAQELIELFSWYLGLFVGTVQLIFMPEGGIWMTGGVALNHLGIFTCKDFQEGIEASPAYLSQRKQFPLGVLRNPDHAFVGGAYYAVKRLLS